MTSSARIHGIDLRLRPAAEATIPITDLTLRRGYGAFDFLRVEDGVPLFVEDHLARFRRSATLLGLPLDATPDALAAHVHELIEANGAGPYGIQLFLTGGDSPDGASAGTPRLLALTVDLPSYPESFYRDGAALLLHRHQRDLPEAKSTNYFTSLRLVPAMRAAEAADVLYHDGERVLETSRCNLFLVDDEGALVTPGRDVLPGVTRGRLLAALEDTRRTEVRDVALGELWTAREVFLTSTTKGAMPVVQVGERAVGGGRPGPVTREVAARFVEVREAYRAWAGQRRASV